MDFKKNIIGITIGIRFARSFRILDASGEIVDHILYSEISPFDNNFFTVVQENTNREKILTNDENSDYLRINTDDIILGIHAGTDYDEKLNWLTDKVLPYFEETLFQKYKIHNIRRFGIIFHHRIKKTDKLKSLIHTFTSNAVSNPSNISISFSEKLAAVEAKVKKKVNDYKNVIYTFQNTDRGLIVEMDYQYYYSPVNEDLRDCKISNTIKSATEYLENSFYKWLENYNKSDE